METIYSRYRTGTPSFEGTLSLMRDLIEARLRPGIRRVWVQGSNSVEQTLSLLFLKMVEIIEWSS